MKNKKHTLVEKEMEACHGKYKAMLRDRDVQIANWEQLYKDKDNDRSAWKEKYLNTLESAHEYRKWWLKERAKVRGIKYGTALGLFVLALLVLFHIV
jgi:hypothetical protein